MNLTKSKTAKFVAGIAGFAMALSFVVTPVTTNAATIAELQAMIASLSAQLAALSGAPATTGGYQFNTNLTVGSRGADVMELQKFLNKSTDTQVAVSGAGSPGNETSYFGPATRAAVSKFQVKQGISPSAGYFGPVTRTKVNSMSGTVVTPGTPTTPGLPTGGSMVVTAGTQPANSLAPQNAARLPFTTFTVTAGSADVTINSVTVERVGLAQNAVFSGVVLLNSNGQQIGVAKTLNSNNQAMVGEPFVVKAGTTMTLTVAGNMNGTLTNYAGQVAGLNVVAINTSASVAGSLPIMGAMHTVNASLALGTATVDRSTFDPASAQTKEIGTTNYKFSGVRVTAGSAEQVRLHSIRWNQTGSASSNDLANVMVYVDGTAYPTTVSADGKYYSAMFSGGILIDKGNSKDVYIQGDIVGTGSSNRTVRFDLDRTTDVYLTGQTYTYGITPSYTVGNGFGNGTPWYTGAVVTISGGSVTTIQKATSVAAQNIAVNVPNQVLGGFTTDIKGEPISVQTMTFSVATTGSIGGALTSVTLVDQNGAVVAGPVDTGYTSGATQTITFTDTITFPVGPRTYTLKGRVPSGATTGSTIVVSTTPSGWSNVRGETTGNSITIGTATFAMNTMTVKAAALHVAAATTPSAQFVVAGSQGVSFSNFQFDASQSGEDVRFSTLPVTFTASNAVTDLTACQLFDGSTALNTGSNTLNPTVAASTITFDQQLVIPKGTVKTLTVKCNVSASGTGTYQVGITSAPTVTGVNSGSTVTPTGTFVANGQVMTVGSGSLVFSTDSSSPSTAVAAAGSTGNVAGVFKFTATNDAVNLNRLGLVLDTNFASSSDLVSVSIWDGSTQVGTAIFTGTSGYATSTFMTPVLLPKDQDKTLTVKVDLASVGTSQPGGQGHLIKINLNGNDPTGTQGTGVGSGNTVNATGSTAVNGIRMFKSYPTLALDTLSSSGVADGRLMRFKVTANSQGPVGIWETSFKIATTTATVTNVQLYAFTDASYSTAISGQGSGGLIDSEATVPTNVAFSMVPGTNPVQVAAGQTVYFELRASVAGVQSGSSVVTTLVGDSNYDGLGTAAGVSGNFVWSGNATTTSTSSHVDWSNGAALPGFPASGLFQTRSN